MATIKEMAKRFVHNYIKGGTKQSWLEEGFVEGANAVLEVIEDSLAEFSNTEDYSILQRKIKEFKGK